MRGPTLKISARLRSPASPGRPDLRAAAIVAAHNEEVHISYTLRDLVNEGLDVVLIDNDSTDATVPKAREFLGHGLLSIERLPYEGEYGLRRILDATARVAEALDHDWVARIDADEWPVSPFEGELLRDRIAVADAEGYNVLNFDEFVFFADDEEDLRGTDYRRRMLRYYFYEPKHPRLMRAWRQGGDVGIGTGSGHALHGEVRRYPIDMVLRHYVSLGHRHLCEKYIGRSFPREEIERGWHDNRQNISPEDLRLRPSKRFRKLDRWDSHSFDRSRPMDVHFWEPRRRLSLWRPRL